MASQAEHGSDKGTMDIKQNVETWKGFVRLIKWSLAATVVILLILLVFRT